MRRPAICWTEWDRGIYWRINNRRLIYFWTFRGAQVWMGCPIDGSYGWMIPRFGQVKT